MTKKEVLENALKIVTGDREKDYGKPEDNFKTIAEIWTAVLRRKGKLVMGQDINEHDVALCMVGVKLAREANEHKPDNCTDGAGYFACAADVRSTPRYTVFVPKDSDKLIGIFGNDYVYDSTDNEPHSNS